MYKASNIQLLLRSQGAAVFTWC